MSQNTWVHRAVRPMVKLLGQDEHLAKPSDHGSPLLWSGRRRGRCDRA